MTRNPAALLRFKLEPILTGTNETGTSRSSNSSFEAEWNLLLTACSGISDSENTVRLRDLAQMPIRWSTVFQLADQHGVTCLLHQALSRVPELVPLDEMRALNQRYETNLHKVLLTARELFRILDSLDSLSITVMPYKGLAVAEALYGDLAARQSGDIDLLIHARDLSRITEAVGELGYTPHFELSSKEQQAYLIAGYECAFDCAAGKNFLEVQWALQPRFYSVEFDPDGIFQRAASVTVAGRSVQTPSPEDLILVLSMHGAKHMWERLIWLCDIARLMQLPGIDWNWIENQARALGIVRLLHVTLLLAQQLLKAPMPAALEDGSVNDAEAHVWARSIGKQITGGTSVDFESWEYFRGMMNLRERRRDQARFLWRLALTPGPGEWRSVRLPAALFPLYRLVRLSRLGARLFRG